VVDWLVLVGFVDDDSSPCPVDSAGGWAGVEDLDVDALDDDGSLGWLLGGSEGGSDGGSDGSEGGSDGSLGGLLLPPGIVTVVCVSGGGLDGGLVTGGVVATDGWVVVVVFVVVLPAFWTFASVVPVPGGTSTVLFMYASAHTRTVLT
jgi:hypothetical protein